MSKDAFKAWVEEAKKKFAKADGAPLRVAASLDVDGAR